MDGVDTGFSYTGGKYAFFSSTERKWINKIHELKEANPKDIIILKEPEENDGCIYCKFPIEYLKIGPKRRLNLSDEQRLIRAERLKSYRKTT